MTSQCRMSRLTRQRIRKIKPPKRKREGAAKKQVAFVKPPTEGSEDVVSAPPIKRKDMSKEQWSAQNKLKREAAKAKKEAAKEAGEQPASANENDGMGKSSHVVI